MWQEEELNSAHDTQEATGQEHEGTQLGVFVRERVFGDLRAPLWTVQLSNLFVEREVDRLGQKDWVIQPPSALLLCVAVDCDVDCDKHWTCGSPIERRDSKVGCILDVHLLHSTLRRLSREQKNINPITKGFLFVSQFPSFGWCRHPI